MKTFTFVNVITDEENEITAANKEAAEEKLKKKLKGKSKIFDWELTLIDGIPYNKITT